MAFLVVVKKRWGQDDFYQETYFDCKVDDGSLRVAGVNMVRVYAPGSWKYVTSYNNVPSRAKV